MCKWHWDAGVQLQFTQGLDWKNSKCQGSKRTWPLNIKTAPSVDALFIFFNRRPPPPLHLQSMVGRNGLFSGYKSQRTKGHRGAKRKKKEQTFVPLVSSQRNRGDERTEGATLKKPRERADTKKNWGKGTEDKPKKKQWRITQAEPRGKTQKKGA